MAETKARATRSRSKPKLVEAAPESSKVLVTLSPEILQGVVSAHNLVNIKTLELATAKHFLEKINDEIAEAHELPNQFTIDLYSGEITEEMEGNS